MKKLLALLLVLCVASFASASMVTIVGPGPGQPGSAEDPLEESELVTILVTSDTGLYGLDAILTVSGPGTIVDAVRKANCVSYGWDSSLSFDPIITGATAEVGVGNFNGNANVTVGYFTIHCDGPGDVIITLSPGMAFGGSMDVNFGVPTIAGSLVIHQIPEPATIALLCLGGLLLRKK